MIIDQNEALRLYNLMSELLSNVPNFSNPATRSQSYAQRWLGRVFAIIEAVGDPFEIVTTRNSIQSITLGLRVDVELRTVLACANRALAIIELKAPVSTQGSFIAAGNAFDAFKAFGDAVQSAATDVLLVDPYMDEKALTSFALMIPEGVPIRLLADSKVCKPSLKPSVLSWQAQYEGLRPLVCRLSPAGALHDRLIIVNNEVVWLISQSLNAIAARSPASIQRTNAEMASLKVAAYGDIWLASTPI